MSIGTKVRKYRMLKCLSQRDLADKTEVSQSIISSLESDKTIPNSLLLDKIAKELDVDINTLLQDDSIVQNNYNKAIGNIHSRVTINNNCPENVIEMVLANQEKLVILFENQNKLIESVLSKST